jgi:hypothetical protein
MEVEIYATNQVLEHQYIELIEEFVESICSVPEQDSGKKCFVPRERKREIRDFSNSCYSPNILLR